MERVRWSRLILFFRLIVIDLDRVLSTKACRAVVCPILMWDRCEEIPHLQILETIHPELFSNFPHIAIAPVRDKLIRIGEIHTIMTRESDGRSGHPEMDLFRPGLFH